MDCDLSRPISAAQAKQAGKHPDRQVCWVYVICWRKRGPCKIGVALDPRSRLSELQVANPYKLHIWRAFGVMGRALAFEAERRALGRLYGRRLQGEWVDVTVNQAADTVWAAFSSMSEVKPKIYDRTKARAQKVRPQDRNLTAQRLRQVFAKP